MANSSSVFAPTTPQISFFWSSDNDDIKQIPECGYFTLTTSDNPAIAASAVSPLTFTAAPVGGVPEVHSFGGTIGSTFNWVPDFPAGTDFSLALVDRDGNSGGAVSGYTMINGTANCTVPAFTTPSLSFVTDPPNNACAELDLKITGGQAPYVVSVMSGTLGLYANLTDVTVKKVKLGNIVPAGTTFYLFVSDSTGLTSVVSPGMTSGLGSSSCSMPGSSGSGSSSSGSKPLGAIVGGAVGGVLGALGLILLAYYFLRRNKTRKAELAHQNELNNSTAEYRLADGNAPLVTPFVVPARSPDGTYSMVRTHSNEGKGLDASQNGGGGTQYGSYQPQLSHNGNGYSSEPSPVHTYGGASSYQPSSSYEPSPSPNTPTETTDPRTGLANPDDFSYREYSTANRSPPDSAQQLGPAHPGYMQQQQQQQMGRGPYDG